MTLQNNNFRLLRTFSYSIIGVERRTTYGPVCNSVLSTNLTLQWRVAFAYGV